MKDRLTEMVLRSIPVEALPPYGRRRQEFARFLEHLPAGGLGFQGTTSVYSESIAQHGLDTKFSAGRLRDETFFCFLDPEQDPIFHDTRGDERIISTYHRLKNSLEVLIVRYGIQGHHRLYTDENTRSAIVVFVNTPVLMITNDISDKRNLFNELKGLSFEERIKEDIKRKAYIGSHQRSGIGNTLPVGSLASVALESIVGMYEEREKESVTNFAQRVIDQLLVRYTK
ncbi:MAG: hypothetical protein Q8O99_06175 [bacterium]|nr:hypothetical protein [bacterium]